mgnify:FL=1
MDPEIQKELQQEIPSDFHKQMLMDCRALLSISRNRMKGYYDQWDRNDEIFRARKHVDSEDLQARERKEPEKMVVPISFSQIQTFVAFCYSLYTQRDNFFELEGFTAEDDRPAKVAEALLTRDLDKNNFPVKLTQFLLDVSRFGVGVFKTTWSVEKQMVRKTTVVPPKTFLGIQIGQETVEESVEWATAYEGNRLVNVSPYRFFPDVRMPLSRFQEGEFCGSEDNYSVSQLKQWEQEGVVAGIDFIKPLGKDITAERAQRWEMDSDPVTEAQRGAGLKGAGQIKKNVVITEIQRTIVPTQYEVNGKPLGKEDRPIKYVIWIANDSRVIKCEPMNYVHNEFTYSIAQFTNDNNILISDSLADSIDQLQSVISWFINARITNVRKVIGDKLVVNTQTVNMDDLKERRPVIRLTGAATGDIDRHIKQLQLTDVTTNHISDVKSLHDLIKVVTGINDSLLGEVRPGKRSATENRNTTSGAAARQKHIAGVIFSSALAPLGRQMIANLRDGLEEETYVKVLGMKAQLVPEFVQVDKEALVGHYDFVIFDGTLPSERMFSAQSLEQLLELLLKAPQLSTAYGFDVKKILMQILYLRGIRNPERFLLRPEEQAAMMAQQQAQQQQQNGTDTNGSDAVPGGAATGEAPGGPSGATPGMGNALSESLLPLLAGAVGAGGNGSNGQRF